MPPVLLRNPRERKVHRDDVRGAAVAMVVKAEQHFGIDNPREPVIGLMQAAALFAQTRGISVARFKRLAAAVFREAELADNVRKRVQESEGRQVLVTSDRPH